MPHATTRELVLGVIDRRIRDGERTASTQLSRHDHCGFARSKLLVEYLKEIRAELAGEFSGSGGPKRP